MKRSASASLSPCTFPMNDLLNRSTVLVLNRNWQAIHVKTSAEAFCMLATGAATALDVQADDYITPVRSDTWLKLPGREHDNAVNTPRAHGHRRCQLRQGSAAPPAFRRAWHLGARRRHLPIHRPQALAE